MTDIMPCPLCGSDRTCSEPWSRQYVRFDGSDGTATFWRVSCEDCRCETGSYRTEAEAIRRWNTRPEQQQLKAGTFEDIAKEIAKALAEIMRKKEAEGE